MTKVVALEEVVPAVVKEAIEAGEDLTITSEGKPFARLLPADEDDDAWFEGSVTILGDIVEPIDAEWDATK